MRIILFPIVLAVLVALFLIYGFKKINRDREGSLEFNSERVGINRNDREDLELPLFDFKTIANATGLLMSLPNADNGLVLFKADIYNPTEFEAAIEGCHFVFHVATPMLHTHNSQMGQEEISASGTSYLNRTDNTI